MDPAHVPRWQLRLSNFAAAVDGLSEAVDLSAQRPLSELEKAGLVRRFEIAWELGWKVMADYLTDALAPPEEFTPTKTIRAAMTAGIIVDGDAWIAAGQLRNRLSHTYSLAARDDALVAIGARHLGSFRALLAGMRSRVE